MDKKIFEELDRLEKQGSEVLKTKKVVRLEFSSGESVDEVSFSVFRATIGSFIDKFYGSDHLYYKESQSSSGSWYNDSKNVEKSLEILRVIREEFESGFFFLNLRGLIEGEIFSDYLEMAEHLLEQGYKDAAAVIIGSTLENHLRQLCSANSIDTKRKDNRGRLVPKKADQLNSELAKKGVYNRLDLKNVTAWLDLRNNAAHGNYDEYSQEHVSLMLSGVMNFMSKQ